MKIEKQIAILQRELARVLLEHLRSGRHFKIEISGVQSKITEVKHAEVKKEFDREVMVFRHIEL